MVHTGLLTSLVAALVAAFAGGFIAARLRLPPILGYLLAGVAIGPFTPGFNADPELALELAEVGVILLMFGVGIHFSLKDLLAVRSIALPGAVGQATVATILGVSVAMWWWDWSFGEALVFGLAISVASTVVLLRALEDRGLLTSVHGRIAVGWLIVEDIFTVLVLVLLPAIAGPLGGTDAGSSGNILWVLAVALGKAVAFVALMLIAGRKVVPWLLVQVARTGSRELFTLSVLAVALGIALGSAEFFDVSLALGAFLAGVVISESDLSHQAAADALPMRDAFAVLFFVSVGMLFDPHVLIDAPGRVLTVLAIIVVGKSLAALLIVLLSGRPARTGLVVAAGLAQIGEFSFILITLGRLLGLFPAEGSNLVLAAALLSITINPLVFATIEPLETWLRRHAWLGRGGAVNESVAIPGAPAHAGLRGHAVLIGYGRVGRVVARVLEQRKFTYLVVEQNRRRVEALRARGVPAVFGDAAREVILEHAHLATARVLIVAIGDAPAAREVVAYARRVNPRLDVIVETHSVAERAFLYEHGAGEAVLGEWETALEMTRRALHRFGLSTYETQAIVQNLRSDGPGPEDDVEPVRERRDAPAPLAAVTQLGQRLAGDLRSSLPQPAAWAAIGVSLVGSTALALLLNPLAGGIAAGLLYLVVVLVARWRWGRGMAAVATVLGGLLLLVAVVEPRATLLIEHPRDYALVTLTISAMLLAVLGGGNLLKHGATLGHGSG